MTPERLQIYATVVAMVSTLLTAAAACAAVVIYRRQASEMRRQSRLLNKSVEGSNLLRLIVDVLDDPARHSARKRVMILWNEHVPLERWTEADRLDGERVIRTFDLMGLMVKRNLLDHDLVVQTWGIRTMQMHAATYALLRELRDKNGPTYMCNFDWLEREARAVERRHQRQEAVHQTDSSRNQAA